jgi:divalent metal cation (Fe/Co/Zn/Cd) transporter
MVFEASKIARYSAEKRRVALHSMLAAAVMTLLKLAAGLLSGSLGVLSDAAHSGLDMVGSALTFFSVQVSDRPADEDHTYGHGKFENISSFGVVLLMAVSSGLSGRRLSGFCIQRGSCRTWVGRRWWWCARLGWTTGGRGGCGRWRI